MLEVIIIDDREEVGKRTADRFTRYFQKNNLLWEAKFLLPLEDKKDYIRYIIDNKVILIVIDERLDVPVNGKTVNYSGHDIVELIRKRNKEIPIFIITAFDESDELLLMEGQADGIISRGKFSNVQDSNQIIMRLVRSTHRYLQNYSKEYEDLATLSHKVVTGKATESESKRLTALRAKLAVETGIEATRKEWLDSLGSEIRDLKDLINTAKKIISDYYGVD